MFIGGIALNYYSAPMLTHDADFLGEARPEHAQVLADRLKSAFRVDSDSIREAIAARRESNLIHPETGFKIDIWVLEDTRFDRLRFSRRVPGRVFGRDVFLSTPEDLILIKLVWFKKSDSQKHCLDALGLYRTRCAALQRDYLRSQAEALSVARLLKQIEGESASA